MKGLELARKYYEEYGKPMLETEFSDFVGRIAVGLCGEGSECLGFDDEVSTDHDFEPGFCLFITDEDEREFGFSLERAYSKLPREYLGFKRNKLNPVGGNRHGVIKISEFYGRFLGAPNAPDTVERWLSTPSDMLLAASNGEIWRDDLGIFSEERELLKSGYPKDIRLKKLAAHLLLAQQSGQYNYPRLIRRNDSGAAQLAVFEYVKHMISTVFLLNNKYEPFYKWVYKAMGELPILPELTEKLIYLTVTGNNEAESEEKTEIIELTASLVSKELKKQNISEYDGNDLGNHAYFVTEHISDPFIRNMHIMEGI